jgi:nucleotide-binding universal stress UspA family protein
VRTRLALDGGVVVGDDGSEPSRAALRWAAADATRRGCPLHVVRRWSIPTAPRPSTWEPGYVPPLADWEAAVRSRLALDTALIADDDGLTAYRHAVYASPGPALTAVSRGADLVAVGSRGHGALREVLLGSVASYLAHHAACPVVIVHETGLRPTALTEERSDHERHAQP